MAAIPQHVLDSDPVGAETLRMIYEMRSLNEWIFDVMRPVLGRSVLEIGCGIGCFTELLLGLERIVAVDINETYIEYVKQRFADSGNVTVFVHDCNHPLPENVRAHPVETVICLNVLEHIERDVDALRHMRDVLVPGGHVVLLVPAFPALYCSLDRELFHFRRYSRKSLNDTLRAANLEPDWHRFINLFGVLGWFINGKILRRRILPANQLSLYNQLVPLFRAIEHLTGPPFGLSHIVAGRRCD